ncbi:MAG: SDR family NAD(P)-dependent oxidoreductase [Chloroflexota bacterium]
MKTFAPSAANILAPPLRLTYALTKHAVRGLGESLRQGLRSEGVGVTCVYPLIIRTNIKRTARTAEPSDRGH